MPNRANEQIDYRRVRLASIVAVIGLVIPAVLAWLLATNGNWKPGDIANLVGVFTTTVGTLAGAFLGVQAGAEGKQKMIDLANRALAVLPPEEARKVLNNE